MTTTKEHKAKIDKALEGIYNLSPAAKVAYFSKAPCLCCGSTLAGNRYEFTGREGKKHTDRIIILDCCVDCYVYLFT